MDLIEDEFNLSNELITRLIYMKAFKERNIFVWPTKPFAKRDAKYKI